MKRRMISLVVALAAIGAIFASGCALMGADEVMPGNGGQTQQDR